MVRITVKFSKELQAGGDSDALLSSIPHGQNWAEAQATLADWLLRTVLDLRYIGLDRF
jgi:hypothetical protein